MLTSCGTKQGETEPVDQAGTPASTPTEAPLAARVNGEGILLAEYEAELKRYQAGVEQADESYDPELAKKEVLDYLTNQTLFAQGADEQGYYVDEAELQAKINDISNEIGGDEELQKWITENFYDQESFRAAMARDMAWIWIRNSIIEQVPETAEQVHARQILVNDENEAIGIQRQLEVGTPFRDLAFSYDPLTGGELGWFPRGYLFQPDVENAAFSLQPGQYSEIIPTSYGFHIVEVIEVDPQHPLSHDALLFVQELALEKWLEDKRSASKIEILIN